MADNTKQFRWIVTIQGNLDAMYATVPDVFVAGDLLWYPVEGNNKIRVAPDAMVVFGRPKGDRGSYRQWEEDGITPQVVFEILSPGNRFGEMLNKVRFFERYGVEEFYVYEPERQETAGFLADSEGALQPVGEINGFVSPRLGIRFETQEGEDLKIYRPDGSLFETFNEIAARRDAERERANAEQLRADIENVRANKERERADEAEERAHRLAERLRQLGVDPDGP